jgi:hypothetical protein
MVRTTQIQIIIKAKLAHIFTFYTIKKQFSPSLSTRQQMILLGQSIWYFFNGIEASSPHDAPHNESDYLSKVRNMLLDLVL